MRTIEDLKAGYRRFRAGEYKAQADLYRSLEDGQSPAIMLIGCADSRCEPSDIFNAAPGEMFIVRNVANLIPPYEHDDGLHGVSAALEFAVTVLKVEHIVVMGHGQCGGIAASLKAAETGASVGEFISPWVALLETARARVLEGNAGDKQFALELAGIGVSLANLMTFPFVAEAVSAGTLVVHGAWFAIAHGELHWRNPDTGEFAPLDHA